MKSVINRGWWGRLASIFVLAIAAEALCCATSSAAEKPEGKPAAPQSETKARRPRLPNYFARVSSEEQRIKLRAVLVEYAPQIESKRAELKALVSQRDAALEAILTPEQRAEIARLRKAAAQRRQSNAASGDAKPKPGKADAAKPKKAA